jgi:lipopolysaccharide biosynthesis glycosyltransferase
MNNIIYQIALCPSNEYSLFATQTIHSLLKNNPGKKFCFNIVYDTLNKANIQKLKSLENDYVCFNFANIGPFFLDSPLIEKGYVKKSTYFRLAIPYLFPNSNKILYLDSDLIINSDIDELYKTNIDDICIAAVRDLLTDDAKRYVLKELKLDPNHYFNGGVILFNCPLCREKGLKEFCLSTLKDKMPRYFDQDLLNCFARNSLKLVDSKWNVVWHFGINGSFKRLKKEDQKIWLQCSSSPAIIHYTSSIKPWNSYGYPLSQYFWQYAEDFEFKDELYEYYFSSIQTVMHNSNLVNLVMEQSREYNISVKSLLHLLFICILNKWRSKAKIKK